MNICHKCGHANNDNSKFCVRCGSPKTSNQTSINSVVYTQPVAKRKNNKALIITIVSILILIIALGTTFHILISNGYFEDDTSSKTSSSKRDSSPNEDTLINDDDDKRNDSEDLEVLEEPQFSVIDVENAINDYISANASHAGISVAVIDNKTNSEILSNNSDYQYTSWGFYLPVFMAYSQNGGSLNNQILSGILSSDAGVCNQSANSAIRAMGGIEAVNNILRQQFGCNSTTYGRYFGDVNSISDNYTSAEEAVKLMSLYNETYVASNLSYSTSKYGITIPSGATMYSQIGTENITEKKNLNIFAIVKGYNSDYCVVIMTKNSSGEDNINELLSIIHTNMEELSK